MGNQHETPYERLRLTPWKVTAELRRYVAWPLTRFYFAWHGVKWQAGWRIYGLPLIQRYGGSKIRIGRNLQMRNWFGSNPLGIDHRCILATWSGEATIQIGDDVGLSGVVMCAETGIRIGDRVRLGANSTVMDTNFHPLGVIERQRVPKSGTSKPVVIEDDVFVGMSALVLKGSRIGQGSVVGAGSVVSGEIPAGVIVAGNPARVVRKLQRS